MEPSSIPPSWQFASTPTRTGCASTHFSFDQYSCVPGRLLCTGQQRHTVLINQGGPLAISYSSAYQWKTFIAAPDTTICLLPAGTQFEMRWTQPFHFMAFTFEDLFAQTAAQAKVFGFAPAWDIGDALLGTLAKRVSTITQDQNFSECKYLESLAIACVEQIYRMYRRANDAQPKGRLTPQQLVQVISFAHDCMQLDIGLVEMANLVHLSPYHFGRLFKQTVGLSPYQYLLQLRIEFAKKLIVARSGPLGDIAYQLNFSDQAHFSNAFRKATGISPRQYMQSHVQA
jgi:AraC family transcriptional regulator